MSLTTRDLKLLEGLGMFRTLTVAQMREYYFGGIARPLVQRRLAKLRSKNLLRAFPFGESGVQAWTLTTQGAKLIGLSPDVFCRPPNRNTVQHDLAVAAIGLKLMRLGVLHEWISAYQIEVDIKNRDRHIPDAIFSLKFGPQVLGPIAIEVENTLKSSKRIQGMLWEYAQWFKVTDLWLFWRRDWMAQCFKKAVYDFTEPRIWIAKQTIENQISLQFEGLKGEYLDIESIAEKVHLNVKKPDTAVDTHNVSPIDLEKIERYTKKILDSKDLSSPNTPTSWAPNVPDHSLSTINLGEEVVRNGVMTTGCWDRINENELGTGRGE